MPYKDPNDPRKLEAQRRHYENNKQKVKDAVAARRRKLRKQWHDFKKTLRCSICKESHPATLDFHHTVRDPSNRKVFKLVHDGMIGQAIKEIREKCVVLCANCHRKGHYFEQYGYPKDLHNLQAYEVYFRVPHRPKAKEPKGIDMFAVHQGTVASKKKPKPRKGKKKFSRLGQQKQRKRLTAKT